MSTITMPLSIRIREHVPLRDLTTFRVGGAARYFCVVTSEVELVEAVDFSHEHTIPFFILGGGSNIVLSDNGFSGLVIKMEMRGISYDEKNNAHDTISVTAGAGENWDDFVATCVEHGLHGLENLSGIPGTVGAAPVQNIGAYGSEVSQTIKSVRVFDTQAATQTVNCSPGRFLDFSNADCHFGYRDSIFKHKKNVDGSPQYVIILVTFELKKNASLNISYKDLQKYDLNNITDVRNAILAIRSAKLPDIRIVGTAGSFFKNPIIPREIFNKLKEKYADIPSYPAGAENDPRHTSFVKVPLAWILDHICGYKGAKKGNVGTYGNQALVIVNNFSDGNGADHKASGATAKEIKKLAAEMITIVKEKTDIDIEPEVQYVGE